MTKRGRFSQRSQSAGQHPRVIAAGGRGLTITGQDNHEHEKTAIENEAWFKDLVDHARDLIQCVDSDGRFIYVNQAWLKTLKLTAEEADGITLWEIIHPDSLEHCMAVFKQVIAGKAFGEVEATFVTKDGTPVAVEGNISVKLDEKGRFVHTRGIFRDVTERKKMETSLLGVEAERKALLEAIPDLMFLFNREGQFVDYKANYNEELLLNPGSFIGKHVSESLPPDLAALTLDQLAQLFNEGKPQHYEYTLEMAGEAKRFESRLVLCGQDRALAIVRDITERRRTEEALRQSENRLRSFLENLPIGAYRITPDPEGDFLMANPAFLRLFGLKREEELKKLKMSDLYYDSAEREKAVTRVIEQGGYGTSELKLRSKNGKVIYCLDTARLIRDSEGAPLYFDCVLEDITERKAAEEALKASEQKHREILSTIEEGYYEVNLAGNLVFYNESLCKMTGYSNDELKGKNYKHFYMNFEEVFKIFNRVYKTGNPVKTADWPAITKDGRKAHLEFSIALRHDQGGEPIGFRGVIRDISARRQADEKIRYLSYHDQLTGLYNRHFLEEEMKRLDTERQLPISMIMADLNGLKLVNDTYGHSIGDEMLKRAADILRSVCREDDLLARFGGDEFVLYLPCTPEKDAQNVCRRIEQACRSELVNDVPLSLSTGLAVKASAGQKLPDLLREAEDSMYRDKLTESRSGKSAIVRSLLKTLAAKSFETETHTRNMQEIAKSIGEKLGLPSSELHRLKLLITLHDIGKINIPEELLTKKESLSDAEWAIMKKHSETGYRVAKATDSFAHVAEDILAHHERWDGSGYPQGLKGPQIPLLARITAIADAFEVMSNGRPYKKAMSRSEVVAELKKCAGTQFDPALTELFLTILESKE